MFFKRKPEKSDITVEERAMENKKATLRLLRELSNSGEIDMKKWQDAISGEEEHA